MKKDIKNWNKFLNENIEIDFKKGDKVLVNSDIVKKQMEFHESLLKNTLGNHFKKEIHMAGNNTELYDRALRCDVATIIWVERSKNDSAMVNLIFDDGFECSTTKTSISKVR
jgi:hypothetical protein